MGTAEQVDLLALAIEQVRREHGIAVRGIDIQNDAAVFKRDIRFVVARTGDEQNLARAQQSGVDRQNLRIERQDLPESWVSSWAKVARWRSATKYRALPTPVNTASFNN